MRARLFSAAIVVLAACTDGRQAERPPPRAIPTDAVGHFCGMTLAEHEGPKGQIFVAGRAEPIWFTSAVDTVAFTLLAEEPKDTRAIYVTDMATAPSWSETLAANWVEARAAWFVIGSGQRGGMGVPEAVPFGSEEAARAFVAGNGGRITRFGGIPRDYVLSGASAAAWAPPPPPAGGSHSSHGGAP